MTVSVYSVVYAAHALRSSDPLRPPAAPFLRRIKATEDLYSPARQLSCLPSIAAQRANEESSMAAFCSTCGKPLAPDANFCRGCGAPSSTGATPQAPVSAQPVQATPNPVPAPVKSGSSVLKILLVLFLLGSTMVVLAGVGVYFYGNRKIPGVRKN